jgi:cyclase
MNKIWPLIVLCCVGLVTQADEFAQVEINVTPVRAGVYMLQGAGGNIGVLATPDGLIMVDDEYAPLAQRIEAAMQKIEAKPIKYVINTHYHGDHTGSNHYFAKLAPIVAQHNVRQRLQEQSADEQVSLPNITYESGMTIFLADEQIQLRHLQSGHTDGDTVVYFKQANVLHTGDLFFEIGFPYIDLKHGGSVQQYLANVRTLIEQMPDDVLIIPGHGKLANKQRYQEFAQMIEYSIQQVKAALVAGKTEQQIIQQGLGKDYQQWSWSFINEQRWLTTLIQDLK